MNPSSRSSQGYSDFFTSGLRAMTGRDRRRSKAMSVDLSQPANNRSSFWTDEFFESGQSNTNLFSRRRRHASVIIGDPETPVKDDGASTVSPTKKRRSGLSSFSARWFSRAKEPVSIPQATYDEDDHALYADDEKDQSSFSFENPSLPSLHDRIPPLHPIDPFSSWSDGGNAYPSTDLSTFKAEWRRESFLSLNSSSSNVSFVFPAVPWSRPTFAALTPSPNTRSSSSWDPEEGEEEEVRVESQVLVEETAIEGSDTSEDQETCDWDAPARIDWRQFHVHLLQIANDGNKL